jgi:serine O-acetyltransferase
MTTPISWAETRVRMKADREALAHTLDAVESKTLRIAFLNPSYQAIALHRVAHYFYQRKMRWVARFFWHLDLFLTGCDIPAISDIGAGAVILHPQGSVIVGKIGRNAFFFGQNGMGGGISAEDIGAGSGLPMVGDDVVFGFGSIILGPVRVGSGARLGPRCLVARDIPPGGIVTVAEPMIRKNRAAAEVV